MFNLIWGPWPSLPSPQLLPIWVQHLHSADHFHKHERQLPWPPDAPLLHLFLCNCSYQVVLFSDRCGEAERKAPADARGGDWSNAERAKLRRANVQPDSDSVNLCAPWEWGSPAPTQLPPLWPQPLKCATIKAANHTKQLHPSLYKSSTARSPTHPRVH